VSKQVKRWAKKARRALLTELGPFCHWPGCTVRRVSRLEFDHIEGRDWECTGMSTDQRMVRYRAEAARGELQVLCDLHNRIKGDPQGRPHWRDVWFKDLYAGAFGERVEA
jgi:hypothetical protein